MALQGTNSGYRVVLKRNCSIAPAPLFLVFAAISVVSLAIGAGFARAGAWMVLPFAGLEVVALGVAFLVNGWHAADYERIELAADGLTVEVARGGQVERRVFDLRRASVAGGAGAALLLRDREGALEIGRHLDAAARDGLRSELTKRLRNWN